VNTCEHLYKCPLFLVEDLHVEVYRHFHKWSTMPRWKPHLQALISDQCSVESSRLSQGWENLEHIIYVFVFWRILKHIIYVLVFCRILEHIIPGLSVHVLSYSGTHNLWVSVLSYSRTHNLWVRVLSFLEHIIYVFMFYLLGYIPAGIYPRTHNYVFCSIISHPWSTQWRYLVFFFILFSLFI
jgi:hypothetical protein